ncbi:ExbD/TolR family protein [Schlesneria sp. T3-172]|uniref:ExbD/TolR family protein n=1 Tax=Schlesneria TaxID=656899 RepID=UPI002EEBA782
MKLRNRSSGPTKVEIPMAPMIDIVFQLLIFFMLNLKIVAPEGNFNINMPIAAPQAAASEQNLPDIKVSLVSDRSGNLTQLVLGSKNLGNDDAAFDRLNREILQIIGRPGNPLTKDVEVEIDADYETQYKYVVKAISKCTGRYDPASKQVTRYVEKIKFAPPHKPKA